MDLSPQLFLSLLVLTAASAVGIFFWRRRWLEQRDSAALDLAVERNLHLPPSLHPVIDPDICIGSLSCVKACPEGDILGLVNGAAQLIEGANCIGHGRCAEECPVEAIRLVFGTSERGVDLPQVDGSFETSRKGVHIVGELGGMGLIKNAMRQGLEVSGYLAEGLTALPEVATVLASPNSAPQPGAFDSIVDVAIVGAGPAGIATALGCKEKGLRARVLEQGSLGGAASQYPRHKVVMTETLNLPIYGKFGKRLISKEELLGTFKKIVSKASIKVEEGVRVTGIDGQDGDFSVQTDKGTVRARKVVLAVGRRGTPIRIGAPGEDLPKVATGLLDPEQYAGSKVLIVGGGDSAVEAAAAIAEATDATVSLSYRGPQLSRPREANRQRIAALAASGKVNLLLGSTVKAIRQDSVLLKQEASELALPNDYVISCLGGELPSAFLQKVGISVRRHHGTPGPKSAPIQLGLPKSPTAPSVPDANAADKRKAAARAKADRRHSWFAWGLFALGVLTLLTLAVVGGRYYLLPVKARLGAPNHSWLKPSGLWGHGVGIGATAVMLLNFLYPVRKHVRLFKRTGAIRWWLTFHVFVGFMSPMVIAFHAAFQSNNHVATATFVSLLVVVGTGIVGRYVYGLVPGRGEAAVEHSQLAAAFERLKSDLGPVIEEHADSKSVRDLFELATTPPKAGSLPAFLLKHPLEQASLRYRLWRIHRLEPGWAHYGDFRDSVLRLVELRNQVRFFRSLKKLLAGWRAFHLVLAVLLVLMIAAHITVSLYLGYRWIFR